jgi:hypothetical protein
MGALIFQRGTVLPYVALAAALEFHGNPVLRARDWPLITATCLLGSATAAFSAAGSGAAWLSAAACACDFRSNKRYSWRSALELIPKGAAACIARLVDQHHCEIWRHAETPLDLAFTA